MRELTFTDEMDFTAWLLAQSERDDPVGDLARDARADRKHPNGTPEAWREYLHAANACDGAFRALAGAVEEWEDRGAR